MNSGTGYLLCVYAGLCCVVFRCDELRCIVVFFFCRSGEGGGAGCVLLCQPRDRQNALLPVENACGSSIFDGG